MPIVRTKCAWEGGELGSLKFYPVLWYEVDNIYGLEIYERCKGGKINDTRIYPGSPHNPRVLQSPYAVRDFHYVW